MHNKNISQTSFKVKEYALLLGMELWRKDIFKYEKEELRNIIIISGLLHDIGKASVMNELWNKENQLSNVEWEIMKTHTIAGHAFIQEEVLPPMELPYRKYFEIAADCCLSHHEWWDGRGYPMNKEKYEMPEIARMIAIVDSFDAMTAERPYRKNLTWKDALKEIQIGAGTQFDPTFSNVFIDLMKKNMTQV